MAAIDMGKLREAFDAEGPNYSITVDRFRLRPDDYKFEQASQLWKFVQAIAARGGFTPVAAIACTSIDALLEAHAAAAIAAHEHGEQAGYYADLRAAEKAIRDVCQSPAQPTNPTE